MNDSSVNSVAKPGVYSIPFSKIPGQTKLFLDYQKDPTGLRRFYPNTVATHHELATFVPAVLDAYETPREELAEILRTQQRSFGAGEASFRNVDSLERPGTVAVLTGQQAGLFSGPLYTIYKALSAVRLSECLREKGIDAVPIFWAATEDHDFDEVSDAFGVDPEGRLFGVSNRPPGASEGLPVGRTFLDDSIGQTISEFCKGLDWQGPPIPGRELLKAAYRPGVTFGMAFASLVARLFAPFGLIVVDPLDDRLKALCKPLYSKAAENLHAINARLLERDRELRSDGYHSQVLITPEYVPLFWHGDDGVRRSMKLKPDGSVAVAGMKGSRTVDELESRISSSPERFSPAVMLRPVVQDYLFPTICYFGGAAEVAYFAQNGPVYETLGRPVTPIMHRQSFTVVEAKHRRTLERFDLDLLDLLRGLGPLIPEVIARYVDPNGVRRFADAEEAINTELNGLDQYIAPLDPTLADSLAKRRKKIIYHIGALRSKFERARLKKDADVERRLSAAIASLAPREQLQERTLNVFSFLAKYGPAFIDRLYGAIDLDDRGHRVVNI